MRFLLFYFILLSFINSLYGQTPDNDNISNPKILNSITGYCSEDAAYNNIGATASGYGKARFWLSEGKDIWYKFTALKTDVSITVYGKTSDAAINTLISPLIAIYTYNGTALSEMIGSMNTSGNLTNVYKGGLTIGAEYYIRISAEDDHTGTFKLCVNNYSPPVKPGQDCATASVLCNKETVSEISISGAGNNNQETAGTCLQRESNTVWYKWTAANNGTLTFNITPSSNTDDIDWVLYDLGASGDCTKITAENAIRCSAGSGVNCTPSYYITGLNQTSTDTYETRNCPPGQDGWLKYIDMIEGHNYALIIDNFSSRNNGFTLSFGGSGEFKGPKAPIEIVKNNLCSSTQSFTFTAGPGNYQELTWNFGDDASITTAKGTGPHLITYHTDGPKTVTLEAANAVGCTVSTYYNMFVAHSPEKPVIFASKTLLCINDTLKLNTPDLENVSYYWTGPNGFSSNLQNPVVPITGPENTGNYSLTVKKGECESEVNIINIPEIPKTVTASFYTDPAFTGKYAIPLLVNFINQSTNASSFYWDFGDGSSATGGNPKHTYTKEGEYEVSLTAFTKNQCFNTVVKGTLTLLKDASVFIPSVFSPNGDGLNDEFQISIANLKVYHLTIFTRWGIKVFESWNVLRSWNGKYNNEDLAVGIYYYLITGKDFNNKAIKQSGSITLLR